MQYDEEWGYLCVGALTVYFGEEGQSEDSREERYREHFYEDGVLRESTEIISREEVSEIWSDLWE